MRDREVIEKEIYRAREDLEASLSELRHAVAEKIDVKARARVAMAKGRLAAKDALVRGRDAVGRGFERGKDVARERPGLVAGIAGGLVAAGVLIYVGRRKDWW